MTFNNEYPDKVKYLEDTDFDGPVLLASKGNDLIFMVMVKAAWCGHCQTAFPEYAEFTSTLRSDTKIVTTVASIDDPNARDSEKRLKDNMKTIFPDLKGYPSIYFFRNGKIIDEYKGARKASAFAEYVKKFMN